MGILDSIHFVDLVPILNKSILILAILLLLLQIFLIWSDLRDEETMEPYRVPTLFLFAIAIAAVLIFHFSAFHLIWIVFVCPLVGFGLMLLPPVQKVSIGALVFLAGGGLAGFGEPDEQEREYFIIDPDDLVERTTSKKQRRQQKAMKSANAASKKSDKGFG